MKYVYHSLVNNFFILAFSLTLLLLSINHYIVIIPYFLFNFYVYKKDKRIFYANLVISVLTLVGYIVIKLYQDWLINHYTGIIRGKIIEIKDTPYYTRLTLRFKIFNVRVDDYEKNVYKLGMIVEARGNAKNIEGSHLPNGFSYKNYFFHSLYLLEIKASEIRVERQGISVYFLHDLVDKYLKFFFKNDSLIILEGFILGNTSNFSQNFSNSLRINGIVHLFAVSGLHVSIIIGILDKILGKNRHKTSIINTILGVYLVMTRFMISIRRAVITYFLKNYLNYKEINLSSLDITSIVYILFVVMNPYVMYNLGFILSFFATFVILLLNESIKGLKQWQSLLVITCVINLLTLPILINSNNKFNLLTPFINLVMVFLVETLILPFSFFVFIFPVFNQVFSYIVSAFIYLSELISKLSLKIGVVVVIGSMSFLLILLFYLLIFVFLRTFYQNKKMNRIIICLFIFLCGFLLINGSINITPTLTFFDLSVGEATLIETGTEKVLIDTGIGRNNELTLTLESMGVKKIDYMFLTHNHSDHNGEAESIMENITVKNIVISPFDDSKFKNYKNSCVLKGGETLKTRHIDFICLNPYIKSNNVNNNSLVLYFKIRNTSFLFTGDSEKEVEERINDIDVDVLKVGHHGSITSTTTEFLNKIRPKYAIIQSGRSNSFEFPSKIVIDRLKNRNIKTFVTKDNYTIEIKVYKHKIKVIPMNY